MLQKLLDCLTSVVRKCFYLLTGAIGLALLGSVIIYYWIKGLFTSKKGEEYVI